MVKYREILRLTRLGISQRNIAFSCGCATSTVQAVQQAARAKRLEWPLPEEMDDAAIYRPLYPPRDRRSPDKAPIDHELVEREMGKRGVTMVLLWNEYCDKALASGWRSRASRRSRRGWRCAWTSTGCSHVSPAHA